MRVRWMDTCTPPTHTSLGSGFVRQKKKSPAAWRTWPATSVAGTASTCAATSASVPEESASSVSREASSRQPSCPGTGCGRSPARPMAAGDAADTRRRHVPGAACRARAEASRPSAASGPRPSAAAPAASIRQTRTYARSASSSPHSTSNSVRSRAPTNTSTLPPQESPTSWARAVEAWNFSRRAGIPSRQSSAVCTTLPSIHPPDTDPAMPPSSLTAMTDPHARGDDPQVFTTWASATALPAENHRCTSFRTSRMSLTPFCPASPSTPLPAGTAPRTLPSRSPEPPAGKRRRGGWLGRPSRAVAHARRPARERTADPKASRPVKPGSQRTAGMPGAPGGRAAHAATAARPGSRQDPPTRQAGGTWRSPRWPGSTSDGWEAAAPLRRRSCDSSGSRRRCRHALVPEAGR